MTSTTDNVTVPRRIGFAIGDCGFNIYFQGTSFFLFIFYTDVMGISPFWAGTAMFIAMFWDGITDPIMGGIADRTRSRWGRYRPYLLFGGPLLALSFSFTFYVPSGVDASTLVIYAVVTHLVFRTLYTVVNIPFSSLMARMTTDTNLRSSLAGWRMQFAALGGLTTVILTPQLVAWLSVSNPKLAWFHTAIILSVLASVIFLICFQSTSEPDEDPNEPLPAAPSLKTAVADVMMAGIMLKRNPALVRVFVGILMASLCLSMVSKNILYWFKYAVGDEKLGQIALFLPVLMLVIMAPIWVLVARRTSKRMAWLNGCCISILGYIAFFFTPQENGWLAVATLSFAAIGNSAFAVMFWSMLPDTVEYDQWKTGQRHEAKTFGFATFGQKAALGLNALILGILLEAAGFVANVPQSQHTIDSFRLIMTVIPIAGIIVTMLALRGYPIDAEFHQKMKDDIAARPAR